MELNIAYPHILTFHRDIRSQIVVNLYDIVLKHKKAQACRLRFDEGYL